MKESDNEDAVYLVDISEDKNKTDLLKENVN